jgi:hypothetical protein
MSLRGMDGRGKGGDVVRPVVAAAIDEEQYLWAKGNP